MIPQRCWTSCSFAEAYQGKQRPVLLLRGHDGHHSGGLRHLVPPVCRKIIYIYTLWWTYKKQWKITIFNGKIHYKWPFSIAMLVHQRVVVWIQNSLAMGTKDLGYINSASYIRYMLLRTGKSSTKSRRSTCTTEWKSATPHQGLRNGCPSFTSFRRTAGWFRRMRRWYDRHINVFRNNSCMAAWFSPNFHLSISSHHLFENDQWRSMITYSIK